ncbi:alpha/beta fold hydrolase [Tropicimonas marinistellae]|uniref:alpha/beta fold hydrolase n=1 Tax=Tropicimonas marinistellae TaxID=1739787 RepID=UPI00083291E9|nr:DUF3141 domain-containing protein [Tropicimonas marinistellae]
MHRSLSDTIDAARGAAELQSYFLQTVTQRLGVKALNKTQADADRVRAEAQTLVEAAMPSGDGKLVRAWAEYVTDAAQRSVLTLDALRKWSDMNIETQDNGAPPEHVLMYDFEIVMEGKDLPEPSNYVLLRILPDGGQDIKPWKRPYVIIDPRAGHGPGIGGFKKESQVGVALADGHPVYFVTFRQMPQPGQTLAHVTRAEAAFLRKIRERHPDSPNPIVVGNCQGGWATAILAATNPDLAGPIVLNGAPMSYWSGKLGQDPMRYSAGVNGGTFLAQMASDLGGGIFDGAYLVDNFEKLNPGRNYFRKYYDLYATVDDGVDRFLDFEKWWGAFYCMTGDEIRWIVENLFVGNKLGQNTAQLEPGRPVDLKAIRAPIICFASHGDNITPVGQALNWIVDTYADEHEIEVLGQRILYLVHEDVGHLGIFVSSKIAKREHTEMASTLKTIEALAPGLYEIVIEDVQGEGHEKHFALSFARRTLKDVAAHSGLRRDEPAFAAVARASEAITEAYDTMVSPVLQATVTEDMGKIARDTHPMRLQRRAFGTSNPLMANVPAAAENVRNLRKPVAKDNPFLLAEQLTVDMIETSLNMMTSWREAMQEVTFFSIWGAPMAINYGIPRNIHRTRKRPEDLVSLPGVQDALARTGEGGFAEGLLRILILLANTRADVRQDRLARSAEILSETPPFHEMPPELRTKKIQEQTLIVEYGGERAIETLPQILTTGEDRMRALDTAKYIAGDPTEMEAATRAMIERIEGLLGPVAVPNAAQ